MPAPGRENRAQENSTPAEVFPRPDSGAERQEAGEDIVAPASEIHRKVVHIDREAGYTVQEIVSSDAEGRYIAPEVVHLDPAGQVDAAAMPVDETLARVDDGGGGADESAGGEGDSAGGEGDGTERCIEGEVAGVVG